MMDQHSLCCTAILLLSFASLSSSSLTASANISTSWTNIPSWSHYIYSPNFFFNPILSIDGRFACGFYCDTEHTRITCLFAVVIHGGGMSFINSTIVYKPQVVWSANRNHPVKLNATLQLTRDGDLVLVDADGTFVWSTNTSGKSVSSLNLREDGNLILFDRSNATIWQSFDHPTHSLLVGQTLVRGQKLIADTSPSNWSEGLYSLLFTRSHLRVYIDTNTPTIYYENSIRGERHLKYENGSFNWFTFPHLLVPQFMRLESDGHLKVFEFRGIDWKVVVDLLTDALSECGYPMACGKYGICLKGQCGCPDEANSKLGIFRQTNYRQPNLGCSPVTPISCDQSQYHSLLELKGTMYFGFNPLIFNTTRLDAKTKVEDCKKRCLSNCSCKAVFSYAVALNTKPGCVLLFEAFSFVIDEYKFSGNTIFLKVQKPQISTGRKSRSQPEEDMHLLRLFERKGEEGQLLDMVDKHNADMQLHRAEVVGMMKVVVWCLQSDYQRRPSMTVVVQVLEGFVIVPDNLDYNFINAPARRTVAAAGDDMDAIDDGTPLLASVLSGPR
ncbi:hypothetical protein Vadar_034455 [Vaccinium darrowii]|uniref:Uncharacterized protein n=1 Tax=Vaccinium darrowii TaxID=229202 RepID=A0ACB7XEJ9_9ERIC|nr:hypothetical protein Vadar_034455 [Vaccinium darrowii]